MMAAVVFVLGVLLGLWLGTTVEARQWKVAIDEARHWKVAAQEERDEAIDRARRAEVDAAELRAVLEGIKARRSEAGKRAWERRRAS